MARDSLRVTTSCHRVLGYHLIGNFSQATCQAPSTASARVGKMPKVNIDRIPRHLVLGYNDMSASSTPTSICLQQPERAPTTIANGTMTDWVLGAM
jgi:hypothetical protein